ncbi:hypothetical protein, variant [Allomyces macrogynus ATCC 38327]|uniref:NTF2-related export protein n=1 Tax=Allomyces macrogynus (strain ATCC 38327) TaxID=578462 RepID=A0A0L0RY57_ALLM3|nr:hypothetical protein, variant [Allomyces macrogynus ATCC 38327]|eukprot:KNE55085.1 hypothetical protein, variant [Allomyces macrogynus ATCC 38327]
MPKETIRTVIDLAAGAADSFVASYYKFMDEQRASLRSLYKDTSNISWNGTAYAGPAYREFYLSLPATKHVIDAYDAHPVLASATPDGNCCFQIIVHGTVKFANEKHARRFTSTFLLAPTPEQANLHYIANECLRFV